MTNSMSTELPPFTVEELILGTVIELGIHVCKKNLFILLGFL